MHTRRDLLKTLFYGSAVSGITAITGLSGCGSGTVQQPPIVTPPNNPPPNPPPNNITSNFDVFIYGGTPGGIIAAVAAAGEGLKVGLAEPSSRIGGALANGLASTDCLNLSEMGGLARKFFQDVSDYYKNGSNGPARVFEPHVAEAILTRYAETENITVLTNFSVSSVYKNGAQIMAVTSDSGTSIGAQQWIDASYEGDLMAQAGVAYTVGREAKSTYNESLAGWGQGQVTAAISPYNSDGTLLQDIQNVVGQKNGTSDSRIMAYTFRACITDNVKNMQPFPKPSNYNPSRFEGLARLIKANNFTDLNQLVYIKKTIGKKADVLSAFQTNPLSTDHVGGAWDFPKSSKTGRSAIQDDHYSYVAGWLYFVANETVVPSNIRAQMATYGLALDEFTDNNHWPRQMYIREARRMVGKYVVTQSDITTQRSKSDAICLGNWYIDCHYCSSFLSSANQSIGFDGFINKGGPGYQIPFRSILPDDTQANNLSVICCPSSSHIAFSSLRVEPTFMALGHASGIAAAMSIQSQTTLSNLNITDLQNRLLGQGAVLS